MVYYKGYKCKIAEGKKGVRDCYNELAENYDRSVHLYWTRKMEKGEEKAIEKWFANFSSPLLDLGCGTGRYTVKIAQRGCEVVALDFGKEMLKRTQAKANVENIKNSVHLILSDGENLPFKEESFNGVVCTLTFDHFKNCELASSEISRALKKNASCIISTFNPYTAKDFRKKHNIPSEKIVFRLNDGTPVLIYGKEHSVDDIMKLFTKHGLNIVDAKGCCFWHILPSFLIKYYSSKLDNFLSRFKMLQKYAEIYTFLIKK